MTPVLTQRPDLAVCPRCGRHAIPGTHRDRLEVRGDELVRVDCAGREAPCASP